MPKKRRDLTGLVFGQFTVLSLPAANSKGHIRWLCKCSCGNEKLILDFNLKNGTSKSCGCSSRNKNLTLAKANNEKFYDGSPCKRCGGIRRYTGNRACEYCSSHVLTRQLGLTHNDFEQMLAKQKGVCVICGKPPQKYRLSIDHDHETGKVRGLLCVSCNRTLGYLDNKEWLIKALFYKDNANA